MKKMILVFLLGVFTISGVKSQVQPTPPSNDVIIVNFGEGNKNGELYFDEDTQQFISGWISYPVPNGGDLYYMLPVSSVSGVLVGGPTLEPEDCDCPLPLPLPISFSHFEGTIYYGTGSEWGSLVLYSGNNDVLQAEN